MALVELAEAKEHCRVTHSSEDETMRRIIATAERYAVQFLGRNLYPTVEELNAALATAPDALTTATAAYNAELEAARALPLGDERTLRERVAVDVYREAMDSWTRTVRGIVITEAARTGILQTIAALWMHRGDEVEIEGVPASARPFLWVDRVNMGV